MVKLTPEIVRQEYLENKLTSYEIGAKYGCSATWVNILRKKHGIRTLQPWERNEQQRLSPRQIEYIYGALLGDDCLKRYHTTGNAYLLLQTFLADKWDLHPHIKPSQVDEKWVLYFHATERDKFFALISPYVVDCMRYKLYHKGEE